MDLLEELTGLGEAAMTGTEANKLGMKLSNDAKKLWQKEKKSRAVWAEAYIEALVLESYADYLDEVESPNKKDAKAFLESKMDEWSDSLSAHEKLTDLIGTADPMKYINKHVKIK